MKTNWRIKHGESNSRLYHIWENMINRTKFNSPHAKHYHDRGIVVCDEWRNAATFIRWAKSNGYVDGLELDRRENDGNYCPLNCRFVTHVINVLNRRKRFDYGIYKRGGKYRVFITCNGKNVHAGSFSNFDDAIVARNELAMARDAKPERKRELEEIAGAMLK